MSMAVRSPNRRVTPSQARTHRDNEIDAGAGAFRRLFGVPVGHGPRGSIPTCLASRFCIRRLAPPCHPEMRFRDIYKERAGAIAPALVLLVRLRGEALAPFSPDG